MPQPYDDLSPDLVKRAPVMPMPIPALPAESWREPIRVESSDEPPFDDADEGRSAAAADAGGERYWTESRIMRFGTILFFVVASSIAVVKIGEAFPSVAWLPYVIIAIVYGALMVREMDVHHADETGARIRAEKAAQNKLRFGDK